MSIAFVGFSGLTVHVVSCVKRNKDGHALLDLEDVENENVFVRGHRFSFPAECSAFVNKCKADLAMGINTCFFNPKDVSPERPMLFFFSKAELPSAAVNRPDSHLKPGQLILSNFVLDSMHAGIYIGNGEVVHISGHGGPKGSAVARIGKLCPDFVKPDGKIWIFDCAFRFRSLEKTVEKAKEYAEQGFRHGEYNLLGRNCQHFASLCAFGFEYSFDANLGDTVYRHMWVAANCEMGYPS